MAGLNNKSKSLKLENLETRQLMAADLGWGDVGLADHAKQATDADTVAAAIPSTTAGDFDGDGKYGGFDLLAWQRGFGNGYDEQSLDNWTSAFGTDATQTDDSYEDNDAMASAYDLGAIHEARLFADLAVADNADWFRFRTDRTGDSAAHITLRFEHDRGDIDLRLYDSFGQHINTSESTGDSERISLTGLAAGEYFLEVYGYQGVHNPNYSLEIDPGADVDDAYENNDTFSSASQLGTVSETQTLTGLTMADDVDWYRFRLERAGNAQSQVAMNFSHSQGDLDMELYNSFGELVRWSTGATNEERVSLDGLGAGEYFLGVYGYEGVHNPNYSLEINPGDAQVAGNGGTLWLNFDGAYLSNQELWSWAGNDWGAGWTANIDPEGDGVRIQSYFGDFAEREQLIGQIVSYIQDDLSPYGIQVQRWDGVAVAGRGDTTIFIGHSDLNHPHIAADVDFGNNNRTDIAFYGQEWWGSTYDTALGAADTILHEAGHTYGLCHVNTHVGGVNLPESMGLRYTAPQNEWIQDTSFMDRTFVEYLNHCSGRGSQNAHQTMLQNFGLASSAAANDVVRYAANEEGHFMLTASAGTDVIEAREIGDGFIELDVNGRLFQLDAETHEIRIFTEGDMSDQIVVHGDLGVDIVVDRTATGRMLEGKVSADRVAVWNGSEPTSHSHHTHDHDTDDHDEEALHHDDLDVTPTTLASPHDVRSKADEFAVNGQNARPAWRPAVRGVLNAIILPRPVDAIFEAIGSDQETEEQANEEAFDAAFSDLHWVEP